jgi:hypothetical protein
VVFRKASNVENLILRSSIKKILFFTSQTTVWIIFILGLWLVVIRPFGSSWVLVPGNLGDARLNNYILEHFFRWVSGLEADYWNAPFFFPYKNVLAFSDNLLGSAFLYAVFRWIGYDRETSFQIWYVIGFCVNYTAASYVLTRLRFNPIAITLGAFFFTFGLPMLAQEGHAQLIYRFSIPLASFFLCQFFYTPKLKTLAMLVLFLVP